MQDTGVIQGISQAPQTIGSKAMAEKQQELAKVVLARPGGGKPVVLYRGGWHQYHDQQRQDVDQSEAARRAQHQRVRRDPPAQARLDQVQGIQLFMQPVQNITVDDRVSRTQYQYTLEDPDANELNDWTNRFVARLKQLPELEDVATDQQTGRLAVSLVIDRVTASRLGIAPTTIDNTLYDAFGQRQINTMYTQVNQYHVVLESQPQFQQDPNKLNHLYIQSNASSGATGAGASSSFASSGSSSAGSNALTTSALYTPSANTLLLPPTRSRRALRNASSTGANSAGATSSAMSNAVPLSAFSHFENTTEALSINHQGQFPAITVSFNLAPNAALGDAITAVDKVQKDMHMPPSLQADFQGTAASFRNSLSNEPLLILAALVTVYIVLGVLYESFIHPITILSTLPSAGVGAFLALILFHQDLSVVAIIGIVLLIGIVKKNGIMMVDFALEAERKQGKNATDAIYEACLLRFRPIMMTTMAALLGGLPLAMGTGFGSELRRPLGIAMVGGLLLSQALTLYTTPVIYIFFDNLAHRFSHKSNKPRNRSRGTGGAGMNISAPFIHRPVATTLLTVAIALAGAIAFEVLPVSPLPEVDFPTISVSAGLPGASADIMASSVATPLERQFGHIAGVTEMTSVQHARQHIDHHPV